jgi:hypothetical protein
MYINQRLRTGIAAFITLGAVFALAYLYPFERVEGLKTFENADLGISFQYPAAYVVQEETTGNAERASRSITLIRETDLTATPPASEGPTTIRFDFFQNNLDGLTAQAWAEQSAPSNYKLSTGETTSLLIDGRESFTYAWDGLYHGLSSVITHGDWILMATITTLTADDQILSDYVQVLKTLRLTSPAPITAGEGGLCAQVITPARNNASGEIRDFNTPCDVPSGWTPL